MLHFDSEDIDGMEDDAGDDQEPAPIGHWKATSTHDVYMVDTPKGSDNEEQRDVVNSRNGDVSAAQSPASTTRAPIQTQP